MQYTLEDKRFQISAVMFNHKRGTVESVKSITNFEDEVIKNALDDLVEKGVLVVGFYIDQEEGRLPCYRVKKTFVQNKLFNDETL
jgi:hypothetical protein